MAGAHATTNNGLVVGLRPGPIERMLRGLLEHAARRRADELDRLAEMVKVRSDPADPGRYVREAALTVFRWL